MMPTPEILTNVKNVLISIVVVVAATLIIGFIYQILGGILSFNANLDLFWARFQSMFILAVLIERTVEIYLNIFSLNGPDRFKKNGGNDASQNVQSNAVTYAAGAALTISLIVALSGVRLMETIGSIAPDASFFANITWRGIDILISGGLMSGGSLIFHEVAETIRGGLLRLNEAVSPKNGNS